MFFKGLSEAVASGHRKTGESREVPDILPAKKL
jgi:hypothetical protein